MDELERDLIEELKDPEFASMYGADRAKSACAFALLKAREGAHLTQYQFAKIAGVTQPYIAELEGGESNPTLGKVGELLASINLRLVVSFESLVPNEPTQQHNKGLTLFKPVGDIQSLAGEGRPIARCPFNVLAFSAVDDKDFLLASSLWNPTIVSEGQAISVKATAEDEAVLEVA